MNSLIAFLLFYLTFSNNHVTSISVANLTETVSEIVEKQEKFEQVIEKTGQILSRFLHDAPEGGKQEDEPGSTSINCYEASDLGKDSYTGTTSITKYGKICQHWNKQHPHGHVMAKWFPGGEAPDHNYCRNPDSEPGGPWCYSTDPGSRMQYCDVPMCGGSEVSLVSNPSLILPQITQSLSLNCSWRIDVNTKKYPNINSVSSIAIKHRENILVTYGRDLPVTVVDKHPGLIGNGTFNSKFGYLLLTYKLPTLDHSGKYTCVIGGTDREGLPKIVTTTADVTEVDYMQMASQIDSLKMENKKLRHDVVDLLNNTLFDLKSNLNKAIKIEMGSLRNATRTKPDIFFSVGMSSSKWVENGKRVVYDKVFTNIGDSYNRNTGKFTATVSGYYRFDVHLMTTSNDGQLGIRVNDKILVSAMGYGSDENSASNSVITRLDKGDAVDVIATGRRSYLYTYSNTFPMSGFSGQLLAINV